MVKFGKIEERETFSVSVQGDKYDYIATIKSLLSIMSAIPETSYVSKDAYYICNLIDGMLPNEQQIINLDEAEYLKTIKEQNNTTVSVIVNKSNI